MKRRYCKHVMCQTCMQHRQCMPCQLRERFCAAERLIQSYLSLLVSQTPSLSRDASPPQPLGDAVSQLHACRANNYFLYIIFFIFCSLYLLLFLIVLYSTIVTVYTDNIFLYNYLWQMYQIIHLSPVGCFTPVRGKTVQKNREGKRG